MAEALSNASVAADHVSAKRRPAQIVCCADVDDVIFAVCAAFEGGNALLLDLSAMHEIAVDPHGSYASVQGGASWHDVEIATAAQGLVCDDLTAAGVVLASGRFVRTSRHEHAELFSALCGATRGLCVIVRAEFNLRSSGPRQHPVGVSRRMPVPANRAYLRKRYDPHGLFTDGQFDNNWLEFRSR